MIQITKEETSPRSDANVLTMKSIKKKLISALLSSVVLFGALGAPASVSAASRSWKVGRNTLRVDVNASSKKSWRYADMRYPGVKHYQGESQIALTLNRAVTMTMSADQALALTIGGSGEISVPEAAKFAINASLAAAAGVGFSNSNTENVGYNFKIHASEKSGMYRAVYAVQGSPTTFRFYLNGKLKRTFTNTWMPRVDGDYFAMKWQSNIPKGL